LAVEEHAPLRAVLTLEDECGARIKWRRRSTQANRD
jgi:hypothetical protein